MTTPADPTVPQDAAKPDSTPDTTPAAHHRPADPVRTVLLLRHARSTSNVAGTLAGRLPGIGLDETGLTQADAVAAQLAGVEIARIVSSPAERCLATLAPLAAATGLTVETDDRLSEVDYGSWSGRKLGELAKEDLWRVVQQRPSAAVFPDGEGLADVSARAVAAVRELAAGPVPVLICSHGDVLKAILADALGIHLDGFQRINVAPASLSVVRYTSARPMVERINQTSDLSALFPPPPPAADHPDADPAPVADAVVGGATR